MKKVLLSITVLSLLLVGCLKDKPNVDFSQISPVAEISTASTDPTPNATASGLAFFSAATLTWPAGTVSDTVYFTVNIASDYPLNKATNITVAVDTTLVAAYNNDSVNNSKHIQYTVMPDSLYQFPVKTGTIQAGQRLDTFYVIFNAASFDPAYSYMIPIKITDASGLTISGNLGSIYLHILGNPLAGNYTCTGTRYNYGGTISWSGPSDGIIPGYTGTVNTSGTKFASPVSPTEISIGYANLAGNGYHYLITTAADYSSITSVDFDFLSAVSNTSVFVVSYTPPSSGVKASFHLMSHYNNAADGSGVDRIVDETFVQQ
jgi:hypothetical protein